MILIKHVRMLECISRKINNLSAAQETVSRLYKVSGYTNPAMESKEKRILTVSFLFFSKAFKKQFPNKQ